MAEPNPSARRPQTDPKALRANVPKELQTRQAWVSVKVRPALDNKTGKPLLHPDGSPRMMKVPHHPDGYQASTTDMTQWAPFADAVATVGKDEFVAAGYVFSSGDPYVGGDLDRCFDTTGGLKPWAAEIVTSLGNEAYIERSLSGTGLHFVTKVQKFEHIHVHKSVPGDPDGGQVEMYAAARYFVFTGDVWGTTPLRIGSASTTVVKIQQEYGDKPKPSKKAGRLSDEAVMHQAITRLGPTSSMRLINMLYRGYSSAPDMNPSDQDWFVAKLLLRAAGPDEEQVGRIMRASAMATGREKWNEVRDGGLFLESVTIRNAIASMDPSEFESAALANKPLDFKTVGQILSQPPQEFIVDDWLAEKSTALMYGESSAYKSFNALDIGTCVVTGRRWHGYKVKQGPVLYIAAEGAHGLRKRLKALLMKYDLAEDQLQLAILDQPVSFYDPASIAALRDKIEGAYALIIVDTLARNSVGAEENSNPDMTRVANYAQALAEQTGACVLFIHHVTKSNGGLRGASAILNNTDTAIRVVADGNGCVQLSFEKHKDFDDSFTLELEREIVDVGGGETSLVFHVSGNFRSKPAASASSTGPKVPKPKANRRALRTLHRLLELEPEGVTHTLWHEAVSTEYEVKETAAKGYISALLDEGLAQLEVKRYVLTDRGKTELVKLEEWARYQGTVDPSPTIVIGEPGSMNFMGGDRE